MAEFRVDSLGDGRDPADGLTTLREAVEAANAAPGADRVLFDVSGVIELDPDLGEISIADALSIDGGGAITLDGGGATRLVSVPDPAVATTLAGLTLTGGNGSGIGQGGGAVRALGDLTLDTVTLIDNRTAGDNAPGGAVSALGRLTLIDSTVEGNATTGANAKGGGLHAAGDLEMTGGRLAGNATAGAYAGGGGAHAGGSLALTGVEVRDNATAGVSAGGGGLSGAGAVTLLGVTLAGNATYGASANGGGVYAVGALTLSDTTLGGTALRDANTTSGANAVGGGAAGRADVTLAGATVAGNATSGDGANGGGVYAGGVLSAASREGRASLIAENLTGGDDAQGGGAFAGGGATLADVTIGDNATLGARASGGGVHTDGTLSLARSSLTGNRTDGAEAPGGGLYARAALALDAVAASANATLGPSAAGGAAAAGGALTATDSTLSGNRTEGAGSPGGALSARGGATLSSLSMEDNATAGQGAPGGAVHAGGTLTVTDASLVGNATSGRLSGGGALSADGAVRIERGFLSDNRTEAADAPGGAVEARATLILTESHLAANATLGAGSPGGAARAGGSLVVHSTSLVDNRTEGAGATGGALQAAGEARLVQATLAGNATSGDAAAGGGVAARDLTLINATLTGNRAEAPGVEGGAIFAQDRLIVGNSLVLGNAAGGRDAGQDLAGATPERIGPSLIGAEEADPARVFAMTAPLAGTTAGLTGGAGARPTVALAPEGDNPALDAGAAGLLDEAASGRDLDGDGDLAGLGPGDARGPGFAREIDLAAAANGVAGAVDLGAVELGTLILPPAAVADTIRLGEHDGPVTIDPRSNDFVEAEGALLITAVMPEEPGPPGRLVVAPAGTLLTFFPDADMPALAAGDRLTGSYRYRVERADGAGDTGLVAVTVEGANDPPVAAPDRAITLADAPLSVAVTLNDTDPDPGDRLRVAELDTAGLVGRAQVTADGRGVRYDPSDAFADLAIGETAEDSLVYVVEDAGGARSAARLTIEISGTLAPPDPAPEPDPDPAPAPDPPGPDLAPVPAPDRAPVTPGAVILLDPLADNGAGVDTDPEGAALAVTGIGAPAAGEARLTQAGEVVFRAPTDRLGPVDLSYEIVDPGGQAAIGRITFEIAPAPASDGLTRAEAQRVALLFEAAFDRPGREAGINHWIDAREAGLSHPALAERFLEADEFAARFGPLENLSQEALVRQLFRNVLDREGQAPGIAHWTGRLAEAGVTPGDLLIAFADSPENVLSAPGIATLAELDDGVWGFA